MYKYVNLFYYKQGSILHVSASHCGHLQGSVLCRIHCIGDQNMRESMLFIVQ